MFRACSLSLVLLLSTAVATLAAQAGPERENTLPTAIPAMADQDVGGGFWRVDENFDSVLHIKNVLETSALTVKPVLWMADGTEYDLEPITLDRSGTASINIKYALSRVPAEISSHLSRSGSVGIRYQWRWSDAAIALVTSIDEINSITYTTHLSSPIGSNPAVARAKVAANLEEGLWWLHTSGVVPFVTFVNTNSKLVNVHLAITDEGDRSSAAQDVVLLAGESRLIPLDGLIEQLPGKPNAGGVRVTYTGRPDSVTIEGGLEDLKVGYSAPLPMLSLNARRLRRMISAANTTVAAVGIQLGSPESKMQFPENTTFAAYAAMRNLTDSPTRVKLTASVMSPRPRRIDLGFTSLEPRQTTQVNLTTLLARAGLTNYSGEANLIFSFDGPPDSVLIATGSTAKDATYVFSVDPVILIPETGKIFCNWQVSGATDTMISFWNHGDSAEDADLVFFFQGGKYRYPIHLEADESTSVNIASIIHSGNPDRDGKTIPGNITEGSARLVSQRGSRKPTNIKAHAAIFNVATATCWEVCNTCDHIVYVLIDPSPASASIGATVPFHTTATTKTGDSFDVTLASTWSSSNTGIATVASNGVATGVNYGAATVNAQYTDTGVPSWNDSGLCKYPLPQCPMFVGRPSAPVAIMKLLCTPVTRGGISACTASGPSGTVFSNWTFSDGTSVVTSANGTGLNTWTGKAVTSGVVKVSASTSDGGTGQLSAVLTVIPRNWHTPAATPQEVSNNTFIMLPVPPSSTGTDSGLGFYKATEQFGGSATPTIISMGPNAGYVYLDSQPSVTTLFQYEINPDLENTGSQFFMKQTGTYSSSNTQGTIAGSLLLTQTRRHEYNHPVQSHYGKWSSAISANNVGDGFESLVLTPGHTQNDFNNSLLQLYQGDFNHWDMSVAVEPLAVNQDAAGTFLGNICYSDYSGCH